MNTETRHSEKKRKTKDEKGKNKLKEKKSEKSKNKKTEGLPITLKTNIKRGERK